MANKAIISNPVREDGRVTIPADKRRELGLEPGDFVILEIVPIDDAKEAADEVNRRDD